MDPNLKVSMTESGNVVEKLQGISISFLWPLREKKQLGSMKQQIQRRHTL